MNPSVRIADTSPFQGRQRSDTIRVPLKGKLSPQATEGFCQTKNPPNRARFGELRLFLRLIAWINVLSRWGLGRRLSQKGGIPNVLPVLWRSSNVLLPELGRGETELFFEDAGEVESVLIAAQLGDFGDGVGGFGKQVFGGAAKPSWTASPPSA